jgi:tight adherence protein C
LNVIEIFTVLVFLSVLLMTAFLGLRFWAWRTRAVDRVTPGAQVVPQIVPHPSLVWHELVAWVGSFVPPASKDMPLLRKRLIRAGFRDPSAERNFRGLRVVSTILFTVIAAVAGLRSYATFDNLILLAGGGGLLGYLAPMQVLRFRIRRRQHAIERALPNALDLMVVCVESGLGLDQAILQVAKELRFAHPEICEEFTVMNLELRAGKRRTEALHNLAERTGVDELQKLVAVLVQTDRFGTSIAQSLRGHSDYMRVMARQKAEERAAKLAVKLVFPIFFCVLPSLFVVTVGPVMTRLVRDLLPMIENM